MSRHYPKIEAICENCKHYDPDNDYCMASGEHEIYSDDTCDYWEDKVDREAQLDDAGDREAHRMMVEGRIE